MWADSEAEVPIICAEVYKPPVCPVKLWEWSSLLYLCVWEDSLAKVPLTPLEGGVPTIPPVLP